VVATAKEVIDDELALLRGVQLVRGEVVTPALLQLAHIVLVEVARRHSSRPVPFSVMA
jgi:hypothetical protein